uniref:Uncharacterized protein n=1 Tax=Arundo donax TaxID=35708 RepID=A0A0A9ABS5_ARUDO
MDCHPPPTPRHLQPATDAYPPCRLQPPAACSLPSMLVRLREGEELGGGGGGGLDLARSCTPGRRCDGVGRILRSRVDSPPDPVLLDGCCTEAWICGGGMER